MPYLHPLYVDYFAYFNENHDFFECHEVLEEYWKIIAPGNKEHALVGLIQLATGMYHWRRQNERGALRMLKKAQHILQQQKHSPLLSVLDQHALQQQLADAIDAVARQEAFRTFPIRIKDEALQQAVAQKRQHVPSHEPHFLHNKHMLRDRTAVLEERAQKVAAKRGKKEAGS